MGWSSSDDMRSQVKLRFESREDAIAFAEREGYTYDVREPQGRRVRRQNYSDNFRYGRNI